MPIHFQRVWYESGSKLRGGIMHVVVGGGGTPDKHGALKVVFQLFSGEYLFTQWFRVPTQWLCV